MTEQLTVQVNAATNQFNQAIDGVVARLGGKGAGTIVAAVAAANAAIAGLAAKGVQEFGKLETGMNEVFTLLPGISEREMGKMTEDVQNFAREFGVTTDEVIPALYDALSAGVPPGNVFEFLGTAQETAVGGVTDLNTAVDGLTSIVNAFGEEAISTQEASDLLFLGMRKGKTTVQELSDVVSRVAPAASSLGIGFDEVVGALDAMTVQGEGTREASTKLRQAMIELGKEGSTASDAFKEASGTTFPEFIENGGTLQEALMLLSEHAQESGGKISDMFGSVEAGMGAAMLVTPKGQEVMTDFMVAAENSAGSAEAAYNQMDQGVNRAFERLRATMQTFMQNLGEEFAPTVEAIVNRIAEFFNTYGDDIIAMFVTVRDTWQEVMRILTQEGGKAVETLKPIWEDFSKFMLALFEALAALYEEVLKPVWDAIEPWLKALTDALLVLIEGLLEAWTDMFEVFAALLEGDFGAAWEHYKDMVGGYIDTLLEVGKELFDGWKETFDNIIDFLTNAFQSAVEKTFEAIGGAFETLYENGTEAMENLFGGLGDLARDGLEAVHAAFEWLSSSVQSVWTAMTDAMVSVASGLATRVRSAFSDVASWIVSRMNGIIRRINGMIRRLNSALEVNTPNINYTIPNWIPKVGGREVNINTPDLDPPDIPPIPKLAEGGIVDQATLAVIGEAGPEAVVPLDRLAELGGNQTIVVELDGRRIAESTVRHAPGVLRLHGA